MLRSNIYDVSDAGLYATLTMLTIPVQGAAAAVAADVVTEGLKKHE